MNRLQKTNETSLPIVSRDDESVHVIKCRAQDKIAFGSLKKLRVNLFDYKLSVVRSYRRMEKGLLHRLETFVKAVLFSDHSDRDLFRRVVQLVQEVRPLPYVRRPVSELHLLQYNFVQLLRMENLGKLIDGFLYVRRNKDSVLGDITERRDFLFQPRLHFSRAPADKDVRLYSNFLKLLDRMLRGL